MRPSTQSPNARPHKKSGRPLLLDSAKQSHVLAILSLGCTQAVAAEYVGCSASTIYRTACRNPEFARRLGRARNQAEITLLKNIHNASADPKYWRAGAWALERTLPAKYGPDRNSPLQPIPPDQLALILTHFARTIIQHVPVDKYRKDVVNSIETMARDLGQSVATTRSLIEERHTAAPLSPELG